MKKSNLLNLLIMALVAMMSLTACESGGGGSDDDDDDTGTASNSELIIKLQGTWELYKGTETIMDYTITIDQQQFEEIRRAMEQQSGQRIVMWDQMLTFEGNQVNNTPYKLKGKKLIIEGIDKYTNGLSLDIEISELTSKKLILQETIGIEGMDDIIAKMEYKKK